MKQLEYKGYLGSIDYSETDKCFFGSVMGMPKNSITYEGETFSELYNDFKGAIDCYLSWCEEKKFKPRKSSSILGLV